MRLEWLAALIVLASAAHAQQQLATPPESWPVELTDPHGEAPPADLMLPMPCGAAMAFQRVDVPSDPGDPLSDLRMRLGQSNEERGFSEYLHSAWLRGGFRDAGGTLTYYYIARYELTAGQYRALRGDCKKPGRPDRLAKGGISWYEAVELSGLYTEWLYAHAPASMPKQDGALPFLRLPTETEWEFAARGGARLDQTRFSALRFFEEGGLGDYAYSFAAARGKVGPIGLRKPNPLGLFDVYGNVEELMLEPFRLNVLGREHGQPGGIVTRGGSVLSTDDQVYSAQRTEYPPFQAMTGKPTAGDAFGLRMVLALHVATSDGEVGELQSRWKVLAAGDGASEATGAGLDEIIASEVDPRRQAALTGLQAELRLSQEKVGTALRQSARSTLLAGAVFEASILDVEAEIQRKISNIRTLVELQRVSDDGEGDPMLAAQVGALTKQLEAQRTNRESFLLSLASTLTTLSADISEADGRAAFRQLREELVQSGEESLVAMLDRYWRDLAVYRTRPDIDSAALLALVLD